MTDAEEEKFLQQEEGDYGNDSNVNVSNVNYYHSKIYAFPNETTTVQQETKQDVEQHQQQFVILCPGCYTKVRLDRGVVIMEDTLFYCRSCNENIKNRWIEHDPSGECDDCSGTELPLTNIDGMGQLCKPCFANMCYNTNI
jgi:hypothetical protein